MKLQIFIKKVLRAHDRAEQQLAEFLHSIEDEGEGVEIGPYFEEGAPLEQDELPYVAQGEGDEKPHTHVGAHVVGEGKEEDDEEEEDDDEQEQQEAKEVERLHLTAEALHA